MKLIAVEAGGKGVTSGETAATMVIGRHGIIHGSRTMLDDEALEAAFRLTRLEGIVPALESAHALAFLGKHQFGKDDVVVVTISGRGDKDMDTYIKYMDKNVSRRYR